MFKEYNAPNVELPVVNNPDDVPSTVIEEMNEGSGGDEY